MSDWIRVCAATEVDEDDTFGFEHNGRSFVLYNTQEGFFATDGLCTHEDQALADGFVFGMVIECPLHQGRFDIRSGRALSAPVCIDLTTYPVKVERGDVYVEL